MKTLTAIAFTDEEAEFLTGLLNSHQIFIENARIKTDNYTEADDERYHKEVKLCESLIDVFQDQVTQNARIRSEIGDHASES